MQPEEIDNQMLDTGYWILDIGYRKLDFKICDLVTRNIKH